MSVSRQTGDGHVRHACSAQIRERVASMQLHADDDRPTGGTTWELVVIERNHLRPGVSRRRQPVVIPASTVNGDQQARAG